MMFQATIYGIGPFSSPTSISMPGPGYYELVGPPESGKDTALRALRRALDPASKDACPLNSDVADGDRGYVMIGSQSAGIQVGPMQVRRSGGEAGWTLLPHDIFLDLTRPSGAQAAARKRELDAWVRLAGLRCYPHELADLTGEPQLARCVKAPALGSDGTGCLVEVRDALLEAAREHLANRGPSVAQCLDAMRQAREAIEFVLSETQALLGMTSGWKIVDAAGYLDDVLVNVSPDDGRLKTFAERVQANFIRLAQQAIQDRPDLRRWYVSEKGVLHGRSPGRNQTFPFYALSGSSRDLLALGLILRASIRQDWPGILILSQEVGDGMLTDQKVRLSAIARQSGIWILSASVTTGAGVTVKEYRHDSDPD